MKFIQTDNQIEIRMGSAGQLITSAVFIIVGAIIAVSGLHLPNNAHGQTTSAADGSTTTTSAHAGPIVAGFGLLFVVIGIVTTLLARSRRTVIIKGGDSTVSARRLWGSPRSQSFPTSSIKTVRLNSYLAGGSNSSGGSNGRQSNLSVVLADNSIVDVAVKGGNGFNVNGINLGNLIGKPPLTNEAAALSQFLGVPLESTDMSSIPGMINTVRNAWEGSDGTPQAAAQRIEESFTHGTPPQTAQNIVSQQPTPVQAAPPAVANVVPSPSVQPATTNQSAQPSENPPAGPNQYV